MSTSVVVSKRTPRSRRCRQADSRSREMASGIAGLRLRRLSKRAPQILNLHSRNVRILTLKGRWIQQSSYKMLGLIVREDLKLLREGLIRSKLSIQILGLEAKVEQFRSIQFLHPSMIHKVQSQETKTSRPKINSPSKK